MWESLKNLLVRKPAAENAAAEKAAAEKAAAEKVAAEKVAAEKVAAEKAAAEKAAAEKAAAEKAAAEKAAAEKVAAEKAAAEKAAAEKAAAEKVAAEKAAAEKVAAEKAAAEKAAAEKAAAKKTTAMNTLTNAVKTTLKTVVKNVAEKNAAAKTTLETAANTAVTATNKATAGKGREQNFARRTIKSILNAPGMALSALSGFLLRTNRADKANTGILPRIGGSIASFFKKNQTAISIAFWASLGLSAAAALTVFLWPAALAAVTTFSVLGLSIAGLVGANTLLQVAAIGGLAFAATTVTAYLATGVVNFAKKAFKPIQNLFAEQPEPELNLTAPEVISSSYSKAAEQLGSSDTLENKQNAATSLNNEADDALASKPAEALKGPDHVNNRSSEMNEDAQDESRNPGLGC